LSSLTVVIPLRLVKEIVSRCIDVDEEKVFVGIGIVERGVYRVDEVFECRNISQNPRTRFIIDPMCLYNVFRYAEGKGMDIVLLAHSHPAPPVPSSEDLKGMKLWRVPWLIISSIDGEYRIWILTNGDLLEIKTELI